MSSSSVLLLPLLVLATFSFSPPSQALVFHLPSGRVKCFSEDLRTGVVSLASFRVADDPPSAHNVSASVMDPNGETFRRADGVEKGEFSFVAEEIGKYTTCFWSSHFQLEAVLTVDFDWKSGVAAKVWNSVAKKGKIDFATVQEMELELKRMEDSINSIHEEMVFLRDREEEARSFNETTTARMGSLSILSFIVCIGVAGVQLWNLKTFFKRQKIL
ncbi:hypothetical protein ZIOFF_026710 [Zingiber officinale]|uniref:GOLD domain-containing protein n=1 Tax=Zingiber officinale TaxID=94328 RepID=A0A8J5L7J4_ZINOF|nr:hypothetical protein ZIOFF_026710 [Zingiber officinale]